MVPEAKPYVAKALYSHVGSIPEQLSFKRNELLLIDGAMEGWLSATVLVDQERRGWIPSNYIERVREEDMAEALAKNRTNKVPSRRSSGINNVNAAAAGAEKKPAPAASGIPPTHSTPPRKASVNAGSSASSLSVGTSGKVEPLSSPGPAAPAMSASRRSSLSGAPGATASASSSSSAEPAQMYEALYDFVADHSEQLSFQKGDVFTLLSNEDPDWWDVKMTTADGTVQCGAVPGLYMREIKQQQAPAVTEKKAVEESKATEAPPRRVSTFKAPKRDSVSAAPSPAAAKVDAVQEEKAEPAPVGAPTDAEPSKPLPSAVDTSAAYSSSSDAAAPPAPTPVANADAVVAATPRPAVVASSAPESDAMPLAEGATHRALYPFTAVAEGQLSYDAGDCLRLLAKEHEAWWRFTHVTSGLQGLVAATYVQELSAEDQMQAAAVRNEEPAAEAASADATPLISSESASDASAAASSSNVPSAPLPRHAALYDFPKTVEGQLALTAGEVVEVVDSTGGHGWWTVRNEKGEQGLVPQNYMDPSPISPATDNATGVAAVSSEAKPEALSISAATSSSTPQASSISPSVSSTARTPNPTHIGAVGYSPLAVSQSADAVLDDILKEAQPASKFSVLPRSRTGSTESATSGGERRLSGSKGPPPVSQALAEHMEQVRRNSLKAASADSAAAGSAPGDNATTGAGSASGPSSRRSSSGPPPLSKEMSEHVKRMSISHAAAVGAGNTASAAETAPLLSSAADAAPAASSSSSSLPTHRASYAFTAVADGQLSFPAGALLVLVAKEHEAWWRFALVPSGEQGLAPITYMVELDEKERAEAANGAADAASSSDAAATAAPSASSSVAGAVSSEPRHAALFDFAATQAGQLSLRKDEVVAVLDANVAPGWWSVRNDAGEQGLVPSNYMDPAPVASGEAASTPSSSSASASAAVAPATGAALFEVVMLYDFTSAAGAEPALSVPRGQALSVLDDTLSDWLSVSGVSVTDGSAPLAGLVPVSFTSRVLHRARALYPFAGDESKGLLELKAEQVVLVTSRSEDGNWATVWTSDESQPRTGLCPVSYIANL